MKFPIHSVTSAPASARPILDAAQKGMGMVPNLYATMAGAPALLATYVDTARAFDSTSLSATERQIVLLATSRENGCAYCVAAHTVIAGMQSVPKDVVEAVRTGAPLKDAKLEALRQFVEAVVNSRGRPPESAIESFQFAGYGSQQALEVVLGVGLKTLSNYTNHLAHIPLDAAFAPAAWSRAA